MYSANENLGDWKSTLAKVRKTVHKIFPRELSPTRMLEKYSTDTKKKSAKKLSTLETASAAKNAADDAALTKKIQNLEATALPSVNDLKINLPSASPSAPATTPDTYLVAGLLGVGALALFFAFRGKR